MFKIIILIISCFYYLLYPGFLFADITIDSKKIRFNRDENQLEAIGDVEVKYQQKILNSEYLFFDKTIGEAEAKGDISLIEPGQYKILADEIWTKTDFSEYRGKNVYAFLDGTNHMQGRSIEFAENMGYLLAGARFTACPICADDQSKTPLWSFSAKQVYYDLETENVYYNHAFFNIMDVPVMYFPFFSHPSPLVKKRTGFLAPSFESDSNLGNQIALPFFVNLADNYDVTYTPILLRDRNVRHKLNGRAITDKSELSLNLGYIRESDDFQERLIEKGLVADNKDNWSLNGRFTHSDFFGMLSELNVKRVSSESYLQRYEGDLSPYEESDFLLYKSFANTNFFAELDYGNDLRESGKNYYRAPHISILNTHNFFGARGEFNFDHDYLIQNNSTDKRQRISLAENLAKVFDFNSKGQIEFSTNLRLDSYNGFADTKSDESEYRLYSAYFMEYSNNYLRKSDFAKEILKPKVKLSLIPKGLNKSDVNDYDSTVQSISYANIYRDNLASGYDHIDEDSRVSYGFDYYLKHKKFSLTSFFGQLYRFSNYDDFSTTTGLSQNSSDYVASLDLAVLDRFSLLYNATISHDDFSPYLNEITAGYVLSDKFTVNTNYTNYNFSSLAEANDDTEFVNTAIYYKINESMKARLNSLFDFENENVHKSGMQMIDFKFMLKSICTDYIFTIERSYIDNEYVDPNVNIKFNIVLKGIADSLF